MGSGGVDAGPFFEERWPIRGGLCLWSRAPQRSQANHLPARKKKLAESLGVIAAAGGYDQQVARSEVNASSSGTPDGP